MKVKNIPTKYKGIAIIGVAVLVGTILLSSIPIAPPAEPQTDPENIIILGTFDKNVSIGERVYMQGTIINFPADEKYNFELSKPSGEITSWGYKSTTTNPTGIIPFNFYVAEFGEHTFKMTSLTDGTHIASETFTLTEK